MCEREREREREGSPFQRGRKKERIRAVKEEQIGVAGKREKGQVRSP